MEAADVAAKLEKCDNEKKALKDEMNKELELVLIPLRADML